MFARLAIFVQLAATLGSAVVSSAVLNGTPAGPSVTVDNATVLGTTNGSVTSYIGIPYAQPPCVASPFLHDTRILNVP